ncbi:MAG: phosphate-selective porin [Labilithrix sp.]|nr:phosphate-selective porin [Labilithrix sp.]
MKGPVVALAFLLLVANRASAQEAAPATAPAPAAAPAPPPPASAEDLARLRETVEAQQRAIAELQAAAAKPAEQEKEKDTRKDVELTAYAHVDWVAFRQSSQDELNPSSREPLNEDRVLIRRARLRLATDQGLVHGVFAIDANTIRGLQVRPWNVEASLKWPCDTPYRSPSLIARTTAPEPFVIVSAGLLMTPFGYDVTELENDRPFLERTTMSNELVPQSYDLGVRVLGGYKFVNYAIGIMNGDPIGEQTFPGRDPNKSKDLVFRLGASAEVLDGVRVDAGFSGLTGRGFHQGNAPSKDQLVWRDQNEDGVVQQTELQSIPGAPATPSEGFQRFALGADARLHVRIPLLGELTLRTELVRAKNLARGTFVADPVGASRDLREIGWYVGGTQELTRWAMIGVRYDVFDPDADAQDQRPFAVVPKDSGVSTWSLMAMARWKKARLVAEYDRRKNAFGRDETGAPATLADDSFTLRAVVGF